MKTSLSIVPNWRNLLFSCVLLLLASSLYVLVQAAEPPQPGPEHKKLAVWVGDWTYEGEGKETPFYPAGKFAGKQTARLVLNGFFLETRWEDKSESGNTASGIEFLSYDAVSKSYITRSFEGDGSFGVGPQTVSGNTWSGTSSRTDGKGKSYKMRWTAVLAPDGKSVSSKTEYSPDDGTSWLLCWEVRSKKTGN